MRVVTGGISHETSTFTPIPTTTANFDELFNLRGQEIIEKFHGTNTPTGGFIEGSEAHGFDLVPTLFAEAYPSAPPARAVFDTMVDDMLERMSSALPVDGVLLELHGAMVAEGIDDVEAHLLGAVRDLVGPEVPIVAQLDIHSHMSRRMVELADVLIGRESYPEVDMAERGRECADVLVRILRDGLVPTMALHPIAMTAMGGNDVTAEPPMREAIEKLHAMEREPGVVCASLSHGFPFADVPDMGLSVFVVTDNDIASAQRHADQYGEWFFEKRKQWWDFPVVTTREVLRDNQDKGPFPLICADTNDNPGGGSPADSTGMLEAFVEAKLKDAAVLYIVDTDAIAQCQRAGVGARLQLDVGAKSTPVQGRPIPMSVEVMAISDGSFRYDGPMYGGLEGNLGPSVYIRQDGIHVILVSQREQPFDAALARSLGLDVRQMRYIGLKSSGHFRASFGTWAGSIHVVFEPCVHDFSQRNMTFRRVGNKYPLTDI